MVFRLPTHVTPFVPPPSSQTMPQPSWRGSLFIDGFRPADRNHQGINVIAAEVEGNSQLSNWPAHIYAQVTLHRPVLKDMMALLEHQNLPSAVLMADRFPQSAETQAANSANFLSFINFLTQGSLVAVARWSSERIPTTSITVVFYPSPTSTALLHCSIFLQHTPLPAFLSSPSSPPSNARLPPHIQASPPTSYPSSSRSRSRPRSTSHEHSKSPAPFPFTHQSSTPL
ncbi:hypothetical protein BDV98DRAFT_567094 [Pterulicium gracile]|uniref:Uncharacterized protein n=1 Tax=Pterulicium gracile TaxID=1884261 RepID=A0A5C3QJ21_9AGAR|nr:hypothetical protein BDV98DRAFT_567094 [Pterula gracilis]